MRTVKTIIFKTKLEVNTFLLLSADKLASFFLRKTVDYILALSSILSESRSLTMDAKMMAEAIMSVLAMK